MNPPLIKHGRPVPLEIHLFVCGLPLWRPIGALRVLAVAKTTACDSMPSAQPSERQRGSRSIMR